MGAKGAAAAAAKPEMGKPQRQLVGWENPAKSILGQRGTPLSPKERRMAGSMQEQRVWWFHNGGTPPETNEDYDPAAEAQSQMKWYHGLTGWPPPCTQQQ
eukprot:11227069-Karenia_brevis.AAC.1